MLINFLFFSILHNFEVLFISKGIYKINIKESFLFFQLRWVLQQDFPDVSTTYLYLLHFLIAFSFLKPHFKDGFQLAEVVNGEPEIFKLADGAVGVFVSVEGA